jgi:hypothetical protein
MDMPEAMYLLPQGRQGRKEKQRLVNEKIFAHFAPLR